MKIVWSKTAKKALAKIDSRYRQRIEIKLTELNDRSAPRADIKKYRPRRTFSVCEWVIIDFS